MTGRAPDFILKAMNKETDQKSGRIGCAWQNADGSLSLAIDPFVTLTSSAEMVITLFPNDGEPIRRSSYEPAVPKKARTKKGTMASLPASVVHRV